MKSYREWEDDDDEDRRFNPAFFNDVDPDMLYFNEDKEASITFVYDTHDGKLWSKRYPVTHNEFFESRGLKQISQPHVRDEHTNEGYVLGRIGYHMGVKVIAFWGKPQKENVVASLKSIAKEYPSVVEFPDNVMVVNVRSNSFGPTKLSNFVSDIKNFSGEKDVTSQKPTDNIECQKLGININGRFVNLGVVAANFHMVKGTEFELMKSAFCGNSSTLLKQAKEKGCKGAEELITHINSRAKCGNVTPTSSYQQAKKAGTLDYVAQLQKNFSNPNSLDTEFRGNQRDIDAAWDYLQKKRNENFTGFKQWLLQGLN